MFAFGFIYLLFHIAASVEKQIYNEKKNRNSTPDNNKKNLDFIHGTIG